MCLKHVLLLPLLPQMLLTLEKLQQQRRQLPMQLLPLPVLLVTENADATCRLIRDDQGIVQWHCQQAFPFLHIALQHQSPAANGVTDSYRTCRSTELA